MQGRYSAARSGRKSKRVAQGSLLDRVGAAVGSDRGRFAAFCIFLGIVALTGGGSRADILSLVILRPAAFLATIYALWFIRKDDLMGVKVPLAVALGIIVIALLQLVPLPWQIWTELPGRQTAAEIDVLLGTEGQSRALSLAPSKTWNTAFAMLVPVAAMLLLAIQSSRYLRKALYALAAIAAASAAIGYLQAIGLRALHFYAVTHDHHPVGLFANKNHQAVLLVWLLMTIAWFTTLLDPAARKAKAQSAIALAAMFVIFPLILLSGSRAGLLAIFPGSMISLWLLSRAEIYQPAKAKPSRAKRIKIALLVVGLVVALAGVFSVLALSDRQAALSRLFGADPADELRWVYLPIIWQMVQDFFVAGAGFGAFAAAFKMYEPVDTLSTSYLNQAHVDPLQLVIEGGLPALALAIWGSAWIVAKLFALWRSGQTNQRNLAIYFLSTAGLLLAASLIDYPLRTPIMAVVFASLTAYLGISSVRMSRGTARQPSDSIGQGKQ